MSSLELLVVASLETLHCVSRGDGNSIGQARENPAAPWALEHKCIASAQRNCHVRLDKVYHLTMGPFPLLC